MNGDELLHGQRSQGLDGLVRAVGGVEAPDVRVDIALLLPDAARALRSYPRLQQGRRTRTAVPPLCAGRADLGLSRPSSSTRGLIRSAAATDDALFDDLGLHLAGAVRLALELHRPTRPACLRVSCSRDNQRRTARTQIGDLGVVAPAAQAVTGPERCGRGRALGPGRGSRAPRRCPPLRGLLERQHREDLLGLLLALCHQLADCMGVTSSSCTLARAAADESGRGGTARIRTATVLVPWVADELALGQQAGPSPRCSGSSW